MLYPAPTVVLDGLKFPEGPRWHDGRLWFSDMHARRVMTLDPDGQTSVICEVPNKPSGLGFLEDGRLLVVSMADNRLLVLLNITPQEQVLSITDQALAGTYTYLLSGEQREIVAGQELVLPAWGYWVMK